MMRYGLFVLVLFCLVGCQRETLSPIPSEGTILAFGDSLTYGRGVAVEDSYPNVLSRLCACKVVNSGISGEITAQGLSRLSSVLADTRPSLMILLEGGNDILRNLPLSETEENLARMIELAQVQNIDVLLIGVPEKKLFSDTAPLYHRLAEQYELVFEDDLLASLLRHSSYKSDAVHFNQQGYRKLADGIFDLLQRAGAL